MVNTLQPDREKRVLWHPRQDNKFIVGGGSQITLYEWTPDFPEIRQVTSQHDLQFMKCFAWSPDPSLDDLIAVGLSTGRVDLLRLETSKASQQSNILSNGPIVGLPVRNSRSCNALAFCPADPNFLAVGLDKVRGESSLVIWDISTSMEAFKAPAEEGVSENVEKSFKKPPPPSIPRAELGHRVDSRIVQQHAPTEIVSSLSFLPKSASLLLAGISYRWLRLFDLRTSTPSTSNVAYKVHGISTDPFDPHRFGCFGDGVVSIWDHRKFVHPLLTFTEKDAQADGARIRPGSVFSCIELSSTRRGVLATMERDATYVRFWDFMHHETPIAEEVADVAQSRDSSLSSRTTRKPWANLPWTAGTSAPQLQPQSKSKEADHQSLLVCGTCRTKDFPQSLASFALVPSPDSHPLTSNVMVVNKEGDLELYAVHDTPKPTAWSSRGELAITTSTSVRLVPSIDDESAPLEPWDIASVEPSPRDASARSRSRSRQRIEGSFNRGRSLPKTSRASRADSSSPALFGRGDEDGFPALSPFSTSALPPILPVSKPERSRNYSPMSLRNYPLQFDSIGGSRAEAVISKPRSAAQIRGRSSGRGAQDSSSRIRKQRPLRVLARVLSEDVSMVMRSRVIQGYGVNTPHLNTMITSNEPDGLLTEAWAWLSHSRDILCNPTSRLHGYDFSYEGLLGIWEGFRPLPVQPSDRVPAAEYQLHLEIPDSTGPPDFKKSRSQSDDARKSFHAALNELAARRGPNKSRWKPTIRSAKLLQRRVALELCGWSLKEEDLHSAIKKWETEGKHSRAACWLVFTQQYSKAVDLLMRSNDELHHVMSATVAALIPRRSGSYRNHDEDRDDGDKNYELQDHCERLIVRLHDPYLRAMLTHLTMNDWNEVLAEETLPFRERLAIAFQFLDDKALTSYLYRCMERSTARGHIDALIVSGLTKPGFDILQGYVDHTGDVQTAAVMACHVCPARFRDQRAARWLDAYRDMLDGFKLFHHRVNFDVERGKILQDAVQHGDIIPTTEFVPRQMLIRCNYCNKVINNPKAASSQVGRVTACPHCNRALPRCSICLMTLSVVQDGQREADLSHPPLKDTIDDAIVMCQTCRHGGHASHILEWFFGEDGTRAHGVCAVSDCNCRCADEL